MRLTCPNCDAQYEVPDEVVPTSGRDVQCSNCGQTWFQHHPDYMPDEDPETLEELGPSEDIPDEDEEVAPPPPPVPPGGPEPARRQLDPAVADILRQEAEAEHEARKKRQQADQDPLESQPDLGLQQADTPPSEDLPEPDDQSVEAADDADTRTVQARSRMARMRGEPATEAVMGAVGATSRRELLPDIEEINSTLRSDDQTEASAGHEAGEAELATAGRRGFRTGFLLAVVLFVLLVLAYVFAPQLAEAVPQLDPLLTSFVTWVDGLRIWLDGQVQSMLSWLDDKAAQSSN